MKATKPIFPDATYSPKKFVLISPSAVDITLPAWSGSPHPAESHRIFTGFHFLVLVAIGSGFALGLAGGAKLFGLAGGLAGALVGGYAGFVLGRLPEQIILNSLFKGLARQSSGELRACLHSPNCQIPNLVLMELQRRGEDILQELPAVLDLLESEERAPRGRGWAALTSVFSDLAGQVQDYRIGDPVDECRRKIAGLRDVHGEARTKPV